MTSIMDLEASPNTIMREYTLQVLESLFDLKNCSNSIMAMLHNSSAIDDNPIDNIFTRCLDTPINLSFTENGFAPFKSDPTIIVPFSAMDTDQLQIISSVISSMQDKMLFSFCSQGSGAIYIYPTYPLELYIDSHHVLYSLLEIVERAKPVSEIHTNHLTSVLIQRLSDNVVIPRISLTKAYSLHQQASLQNKKLKTTHASHLN